MTAQYEGNGLYTLFIGDRTLTLSQFEIDEIQLYDFMRSKPTKPAAVLQDKIADLKEKTEYLEDALSEARNEIKLLEKELGLLEKELEQYD